MTTRDQALDSWKHHVATSALCDPAAMNLRIARFGEIPASPRAFVDTWVEGHQRTRMSVIGSGVTDNPDFKPRIAAAERFHVDFIVAPKPDRVKWDPSLEQKARAVGAGFDDDGMAVKFD